jgi:hypothetical protein
VLLHSQPYKLDAINSTILKNMADLMVREVWGAYQHAHEQRILQLTKASLHLFGVLNLGFAPNPNPNPKNPKMNVDLPTLCCGAGALMHACMRACKHEAD